MWLKTMILDTTCSITLSYTCPLVRHILSDEYRSMICYSIKAAFIFAPCLPCQTSRRQTVQRTLNPIIIKVDCLD